MARLTEQQIGQFIESPDAKLLCTAEYMCGPWLAPEGYTTFARWHDGVAEQWGMPTEKWDAMVLR